MTFGLFCRALAVILLSIRPGGTYFLSLNIFDQDKASAYCATICNSKLASIHSQSDNQRAIDALKENPYSDRGAWIGLSDADDSDYWEWDDDTALDYGNLTNSHGVYPWAVGEPKFNTSNDYVFISERDSYHWIARYDYPPSKFPQ